MVKNKVFFKEKKLTSERASERASIIKKNLCKMFNFVEIWVDNYVIDEGVPDWSGSFATECIASLPIKLTSERASEQKE
tara:strand:+ start:757 stop:993 length:237 start_codon:yes stop_codon:yes gene_type:complete